jgi:hypothetical protein
MWVEEQLTHVESSRSVVANDDQKSYDNYRGRTHRDPSPPKHIPILGPQSSRTIIPTS